jgi:protein NRD1
MLVDSMVSAFQRSAVTHKLGVLYIVDAVARPWFMSGPEHAGGIRRLTDAMPLVMNDYIPFVPESQKVGQVVPDFTISAHSSRTK